MPNLNATCFGPFSGLHQACQYKNHLKKISVEVYICNYESNQQDATVQVNLLFLVSSTCFGRCFRLSSGALDCIYSIWYYSPK